MTFEEAFDKLLAGEKITVPSASIWKNGKTYWEFADGKIKEYNQFDVFPVRFANLLVAKQSWPDGWEVYKKPLLFKDLKPGQKFKYYEGDFESVKVSLRNRPNAYMRLKDFYVLDSTYPEHEVILID
jgi:hypothetical protein